MIFNFKSKKEEEPIAVEMTEEEYELNKKIIKGNTLYTPVGQFIVVISNKSVHPTYTHASYGYDGKGDRVK